ncbi:hypothetical protein AC070_04945 [Fannyhessea vaginae]|nr:hypothetical protein AC070_04945 [Fannyhessea vaginae]
MHKQKVPFFIADCAKKEFEYKNRLSWLRKVVYQHVYKLCRELSNLFSRAHQKSCVLPSIYNKITEVYILGRLMQ